MMYRFFLFIATILFLLFTQSCANQRLNYSTDLKNWEQTQVIPEEGVEHRMFLIGDAGNSALGKQAPALELLQRKLDKAPQNSSVIFLGDNIYPKGMPPKTAGEKREKAEHRLQAQLDALANFPGRPIFIPGNHDWAKYGLKGIQRQEQFIQEQLNAGKGEKEWEHFFLPANGCGGPEVVELNDKLVVIVIDSQWWLVDWDKEPRINEGCEVKSRRAFLFQLEEVIRKHRSKNVVVAMHHPIYTYGGHGGYFTARQHFFPLMDINDKFKIPLPGLGSLVAFLRATVGTKQDIVHQEYKKLREEVLKAAKKNGHFIFVSGHEHSLQYIERGEQYFVVSGNGSKKTPATLGKGADFAYGGGKGFAELIFYRDGSSWIRYFVVDKEQAEGKIVFQKKLKDGLSIAQENPDWDFSEYEKLRDSITTTILNKPVKRKGGLHNLLLGAHYRDLYAETYRLPTLDLDQFRGGLKPIKRGGGNQTNSLRLEDAQGRQFVMRSMTKDASLFIPYPFNKITASEAIVEDNFMSTHPFAALMVPPLAEAIKVFHTNPNLYYVPKQPALAEHNDVFGGEVYLVEERPAKNWSDLASFGHSKKIIGTGDLLKKILKNHHHKVDQNWTVRSRLFDLVIGDWDRHSDQWRWARFEENGKKVYRPIPRDRDQPFAKYDGILTIMVGKSVPFLKQLQEYQPKIKNIKWSTYGARSFDRTYLNALSWEEWEAEAKFIQANLTDEVIDQAMRVLPAYAYHNSGLQLAQIIKERRNRLVAIARKHYQSVAKAVDVYGTDKKERFEVERIDDERTRVSVFHLKKGEKVEEVYHRIFYTRETKEIRLFGLGGKDQFEITGTVNKGILIRAIGGLGKDEFVDHSAVKGVSRKTKIYDSEEGNQLKASAETQDNRSNDRDKNIFDTWDYHYEYNFMVPAPLMSYNPDDGFSLGGQLVFTRYAFKKAPFSSKHKLRGQYAFATQAYDFQYEGLFIDGMGKADLLLGAQFRAPRYTVNYFGLGNDSPNDRDDFNYNRVRQSLLQVKAARQKRFGGDNAMLEMGLVAERLKIENSSDRFISSEESLLPENIFAAKYYAGGILGFHFNNVNNKTITSRGIRFLLGADFRWNLEDTKFFTIPFRTELTFYQNLDVNNNLILASRIGTQHTMGNFEFFQAAVLDGNNNLRGYRADRFYGRTSFYHNNDLRWRFLGSSNPILPISVGLQAGFDYGRVWADDLPSDTWHYAYGGGLWLAPVDFLVFSGELFQSREELRFTLKMGFSF